ncbi:MAG: R3H domain-containing nucleic acid-binding protein, partial [Dehalococcoidia bacterium]
VVEIQNWEQVAVHDEVAHIVDQWLRGFQIAPEIRSLSAEGEVIREHEAPRRGEGPPPWSPDTSPRSTVPTNRYTAASQPPAMYLPEEYAHESADEEGPGTRSLDARVFLFGVSRDKVETAQSETGLSLEIVNELRRATLVLTTKTHYRRGSQLVRVAESSGTPVYVLRKNTMPQVLDFMRTLAKERGLNVASPVPRESEDDSKAFLDQAMSEAEEAAQRVLGGEFSVELNPQRAYVRRLQHLLAQRFNVASTSRGREPDRSVLFYRP